MLFNDNETYILNPAYTMKNDLRRVVIFSGSARDELSMRDWESFLHPLHAKIFSFFTFKRPLRDTVSSLGRYFGRDEQSVKRIVFPFIENPLSVYTKYKEERVFIPKNVIVNRKQIAGEVHYLNLTPGIFDCRQVDVVTRRMYSGPSLLTLMLNNTCVSDCIYCYADTKTRIKKRLSTGRILELIEEAKALQVRAVNLMGGELFLHPDWGIVLKKLTGLNMAPEYISTKYPMDSDMIDAIGNARFTNPVQVSLDACSPDLLRQTLAVKSGYLDKLLQSIRLLDESGLKYRIATVLTTYNAGQDVFKGLFRFISGLKNITDWRITPAVNSTQIEYSRFRKLKPGKKEIESLYEFIDKEIKPYAIFPILFNKSAINREFGYCKTGSAGFKGSKCSALNNHLFILPDGKATICEQLYWHPDFLIGDTARNTISEVWNSPAAKRLLTLQRGDIREGSPCKKCKLFDTCFSINNRCWVDIIKAYGKEKWDFPDPRCAYAPPMTHDLGF